MVVVAQLVEPLIVIQVVAGSSPVVHPTFSKTVLSRKGGFYLEREFFTLKRLSMRTLMIGNI